MHPLMKKNRRHRKQVIKKFQPGFKLVTFKYIKNELSENNVFVLSIMMFHDNRNTLMYKVIGTVMNTIIDIYICIDYPGLLQEK